MFIILLWGFFLQVLISIFSLLANIIGWEERLRYALSSVEWDVKPQLNQSTLVYNDDDAAAADQSINRLFAPPDKPE